MQIGAMNHPQKDVLSEIDWMATAKLDFIDLTLEPPRAATWVVDARAIRAKLDQCGLGVIGHTAYYLGIASPFESVRRAAVNELRCCLDVFAEVGARYMNVHPDRYAPMHDHAFLVQRNLQSLSELLDYGRTVGVGIMIENLPGEFNMPNQLADLLDPLPELGMHLDIGHANLQVPVNQTEAILARFQHRVRHVHLHDNKGGRDDLHLPLGSGKLNTVGCLDALKRSGYDGTITLEVFTPDVHNLLRSRDILRQIWSTVAP
jgi:sugar phosphate isomerase/epimerase